MAANHRWMRRLLVVVAALGMAGPAFGQQPRPGQIQQLVEAGAMLPGQRLPIEVYVRDLQADQEVSVRIEPSEPLERVDPRCAPDGAAYVCNLRAGPLFTTITLRFEFVAGEPGTFTLSSRIVHSGVSDSDAVEVLPPPEAGRTVTLIDEGSCTHGPPLTARAPGAAAFTSICPGATLPVGSRVKLVGRAPALYWMRGGRMRRARLSNGAVRITQPRGRALLLRLAKPPGCRGHQRIGVFAESTGGMRILGRLVRVSFKQASVGVREYCDRALVGLRYSTIVIRDLVNDRTVRLSGAREFYRVRRSNRAK
jgi:hypothetical protein